MHEVGSLGGLGDTRAVVDRGTKLLQRGSERLRASTPRMLNEQKGSRWKVGSRLLDEGDGILARLGSGLHDDDSFVGEQRGAQQLGQLRHVDLPRAQPIDGDVRTRLTAHRVQHRGHRTLDQ